MRLGQCEQIENLSEVAENGVAEIEKIRIRRLNFFGQNTREILCLLCDEGARSRLTEVMKLDRPRDLRASVASHVGLHECVDIRIQRRRQGIGRGVARKRTGLPVIELDLVADGQK